jgi:formylglycine-generating enzyme required for sulfatase activity
MRRFLFLGSLAAALALSCGGRTPLDVDEWNEGSATGGASSGEQGGTSSVGGATAGSASTSGPCPALPGPPLEPIRSTEGGAPRECIDATEVTNDDYAAFLASGPSAASQTAECAANSSFVPLFGWPKSGSDRELPVVNVDWCDARAYCAWAGKHLCGGTSPPANAEDPDVAKAWLTACTGGVDLVYPYGNSYDPTRCNGKDAGRSGTVIELGSACEGASQGVYDLSGNVWEWQADCDGSDPLSTCVVRGGSFRSDENSLRCDAIESAARGSAYDDFGIRCCL